MTFRLHRQTKNTYQLDHCDEQFKIKTKFIEKQFRLNLVYSNIFVLIANVYFEIMINIPIVLDPLCRIIHYYNTPKCIFKI